jgi:hypothetical protein
MVTADAADGDDEQDGAHDRAGDSDSGQRTPQAGR